MAEAVGRLLAENRLRPFFLFETVPTRVVEADELRDVDPTFQTLRNLNTPEEYEAAVRGGRLIGLGAVPPAIAATSSEQSSPPPSGAFPRPPQRQASVAGMKACLTPSAETRRFTPSTSPPSRSGRVRSAAATSLTSPTVSAPGTTQSCGT